MYKVLLYVLCSFISFFALSAINFDNLFKKNKIIEARILAITLGFALSYLLTNFIADFLSSFQI